MKPIAFVFPGQGSQAVGMLDAWGDHPAVRETLAEASDALGEDIGAALGCGGHRTRLRRVATGPFTESQCITLDALEALTEAERLASLIHEVMKDPDTQRKFETAKMEPVVATMAQTEAMLKAYRAQWAPVVRRSGFKP